MNYVRWYDKNKKLSELFEFVRGLEEPLQKQIAQDILQILMNEFNLNLDNKINGISESYNYTCKRWYDENVNFFTSFEIIKSLPEELKNAVANRVLEAVMLIYLESVSDE